MDHVRVVRRKRSRIGFLEPVEAVALRRRRVARRNRDLREFDRDGDGLLAAGVGNRVGDIDEKPPKALLEFGGK